MMMMMAMMMMMLMMPVTSSVVKKVFTATFSPLQLASHTSPYLRKIMLIIMILIDDDDEDPLASHLCDDHDHDEGRSISPALSNPPLHLNLQQFSLEIHPIFSKRAFLFNKR